MVEIELKVGQKGQIVIPKPFRKEYRLEPGRKIRMGEKDGMLYLKPKQAISFSELCRITSKGGKLKLDIHKILDEQYKERMKGIKL